MGALAFQLEDYLVAANDNASPILESNNGLCATGNFAGGLHTRYVTSATEEIADLGETRAVIRRYVAGPAIDERVAQVDANGAVTYVYTDKQNSVIALTNATGNPISRRGYGEYGQTSATQMAEFTHPFGYTGRRYEAELGLYYYRARWYDPELGTFLETDPIGAADYINLYSYVGLDPMNATDPSGKYTCQGKQVCDAMRIALIQAKMVQAKFATNSIEYTRIGNSISAYGKEGQRNGVIVVGGSLGGSTLGQVQRLSGNRSLVTFDFRNIKGQQDKTGFMARGNWALAGTVVHEGIHVWQNQTNSKLGSFDREVEAYTAETYVFRSMGVWGANVSRFYLERFIQEGATMSSGEAH